MTNPARTLRWRISPSVALTLRNSRVVHWLTSGALSATPCFSPARRMVAALARGVSRAATAEKLVCRYRRPRGGRGERRRAGADRAGERSLGVGACGTSRGHEFYFPLVDALSGRA